jgi:hypothetical protein
MVKKIIKVMSILGFVCFSFFYTERVMNIINEKDPLMIEIVNIKSSYEVLPVNAYIEDDTVIPGIMGREVDVNKSYQNMKISGVFIEDALVFNDILPSSSLNNNIDKYIVKGNGNKKEVAIIVILNNKYIDKINSIDDVTIFVNHKDLNIESIKKIKEKEVYTYGNDGLYTLEILVSDNSLIDRISNNKSLYCLLRKKNSETLKLCNDNNMYVVLPNIIGGYYEVKSNLSNGSVILLDSINDIDNIIRYIKSKGYNIVTLSKLINE